MWQLNPRAHSDFQSMGGWAIGLMLLVGAACALAARGLWRRTRWGYILALAVLSINLLGDLLNALVLGDLRTLVGLPIGGGMLAYLLSDRVSSTVVGGMPPDALGTARMDEISISRYISETFQGVDVVVTAGNSFFFFNPGGDIPSDYRFPFATLMTNDINDQSSNLDRPGVFRLNVGVSKEAYDLLFGKGDDSGAPEIDYTVRDRILPHPVYAAQRWICVLNPSAETFQRVATLLAVAYKMPATKLARQRALPLL
jgi:hypothetical protein